ncbi:MAG: STAS domain-containing protein [Candidatus Sulfotelmatobacter sp.]
MATNPVTRSPELKLETEKKNSTTTVWARGRIVIASAGALESTLRDLIVEGGRVVLDLANVDYVDSAGLGVLVTVYVHARRTKCHLQIANPKERIRDLFKRSGLASVFEGDSFDVLWEAWSQDANKAGD